MYPTLLLLPLLFSTLVAAQSVSTIISTFASTAIPSEPLAPSGPYQTHSSYYGTTTISSPSAGGNATASSLTSSTSEALIGITGQASSSVSSSATGSATTSAARPSNTQACNGYVEFCNRSLGNITQVVAHNSPFAIAHNAASNQILPVLTQLADGIRGLQFETHLQNETTGPLSLCHTSCNLLNAGTLESYLKTVVTWLDANPYEVITIIMGNDDRVAPSTYIGPFTDSGMLPFVYTPSKATLTVDEWPTLAELILQNQRVIIMVDYLANQTEVPWLLDEFSYNWETPFSPVDPAFPCTAQRPPDQTDETSRNKMYMANHNLNVAIDIADISLLIPAYTLLDQVNADDGNASLGLMSTNCSATWGRPPNWLLVDYYNFGNFNGSVFQVAATANNVSYNRAACCGTAVNTGEARALYQGVVVQMLVGFLVAVSLWL
ncbi:hypothetical protein P154DRAFT_495650 [Amniculicola lignicola CBS 123094]|uniref:PLC-like phosphodiesterase n=1 Tax=Amniculicola lignicola CBS 123094 TaxID=1392246 RepID=A0A6A5WA94_9PLEO|nr:hypothetical protein P154DRAFT_495650 [Amniculicola lignicola CBS 123094]